MELFPYIGHPFRRMNRDFDRFERQLMPYWGSVEPATFFNTGAALGEVINNKEKFAVSVDVSQFKPEELKVNLAGNVLSIEGHHEEKKDEHGSIQRSFVRKYTLPEDANADALRSAITAEGKLTIEAPKKAIEGPQSRAIPITHGK